MKKNEYLKKKTKKEEIEKNNVKAFFFLRHNNDIDHIVPVIYKWLKLENIKTEVIITTNRNYLDDYRIKYIKKFPNVKIYYINDLFNKKSLEYIFNFLYFRYGKKSDNIINKHKFIKKIANKAINKIGDKIFKNTNKAIVVFDWTITYFVKKIVNIAKDRNFVTISLPHGDAPYINDMTTNEKLDNLDLSWDGHQIFDMFDYIISPNKLCQKRYERYINEKKLKLLGSPRYSDEWINILSKIKNKQIINLGENKKKIVLFLRNIYYPVFWEEVARTAYMISKFPNIFLIVKHHPRGQAMMDKFNKVQNLPNVIHALNDYNSDSLVDWADIIMDIGTSIVWEPIKKGKPILALDYLHANYSTPAYYLKSAEINYRDQLYKILEKINNGEKIKFYKEKERIKFINEVIDVPDNKILERYVNFLKDCLN